MTRHRLPLLAVTLGDPAGIGPEVCLKALADPAVAGIARCLLVGPVAIARETAEQLGIQVALRPFDRNRAATSGDEVPILDVGAVAPGEFLPGELSAAAGRSGIAAVEAATRLAMEGAVDGIVTAPLNK